MAIRIYTCGHRCPHLLDHLLLTEYCALLLRLPRVKRSTRRHRADDPMGDAGTRVAVATLVLMCPCRWALRLIILVRLLHRLHVSPARRLQVSEWPS